MISSEMKNRITSRKFWVTIAFSVVVLVGDELGIEVTQEELYAVAAVVASWLGVQGIADIRK
ncbi:hypothetical protein LCGC14_0622930 [marine sediment metagenome]|uniref:Holin n=1 Tax=marine sediment metagenome TaxID=412755 RepID=A0A0F9TQN0_9ZZZZ